MPRRLCASASSTVCTTRSSTRRVEVATLLAAKSPIALRLMKNLANRALGGDHAVNLEAEGEMFGELFSSEDAKEGMTAFVEKREPRFRGR